MLFWLAPHIKYKWLHYIENLDAFSCVIWNVRILILVLLKINCKHDALEFFRLFKIRNISIVFLCVCVLIYFTTFWLLRWIGDSFALWIIFLFLNLNILIIMGFYHRNEQKRSYNNAITSNFCSSFYLFYFRLSLSLFTSLSFYVSVYSS